MYVLTGFFFFLNGYPPAQTNDKKRKVSKNVTQSGALYGDFIRFSLKVGQGFSVMTNERKRKVSKNAIQSRVLLFCSKCMDGKQGDILVGHYKAAFSTFLSFMCVLRKDVWAENL